MRLLGFLFRKAPNELEQFEKAWATDRRKAKEIAINYFASYPVVADGLRPYTLEELVQMVSRYRTEGREDKRIVTDMWLLARFEPQKIGGRLQV